MNSSYQPAGQVLVQHKVLNPKELTAALLAKSHQWWDTDNSESRITSRGRCTRGLARCTGIRGRQVPAISRDDFTASGHQVVGLGRSEHGGDLLSTTIFRQGSESVL